MGRRRLEVAFVDKKCYWCRKDIKIKYGEYRRQIKNGRENFFCSLNCSANYINSKRTDRVVPIDKICPKCNKIFASSTSKKSAIFCSRECASSGSMTEKRLTKASECGKKTNNLSKPSDCLRRREWWKYQIADDYLNSIKENHIFEYDVGPHVFDLCLLDRKILIEFDEKYHEFEPQITKDRKRDKYANDNGWVVGRIKVPNNIPVNPILIVEMINRLSIIKN